MSDLTEYDREIVAAAERVFDANQAYNREGHIPDVRLELVRSEEALHKAVQAKRDAQRPRCSLGSCSDFAVQECSEPNSTCRFYRCDEHRIEVREL